MRRRPASTVDMRIPKPAAALRKVQALGPVPTYAAIALLATVFFFFLHHLGNRIPYELAQQRFRAEIEADRPDAGQARGYKTNYEYCRMSEAVLAGAERAREGRAVHDAVMLKTLRSMPAAGDDYCYELDAALNGAEVRRGVLTARYWWGSKAFYAIALRYLSVREFREFTLAATRIAYLALAVSLVLLVPRTLPAAAPLLVFGAFSSGVEYWADVANGLPYLWAVLSAAVLVWLMRGRPAPRAFPGTVPIHCFAAGTVSSYLWLGDGHTFLAATWIGLLVWFGCDTLNAAERTRRAASCMALYAGGFLAGYAPGLAVKAMVGGVEEAWRIFWGEARTTVDISIADLSAGLAAHLAAYLGSFYAMAWPGWLPAGVVPTSAAASALAAAVGFAVFRARRGRREQLRGVLWIVGLMAVNVLSFLLANDIPYRAARFVFVPLALCWSCLALSVRAMDWRLSSAMLGAVLVGSGAASWYFVRADWRAIDELTAGVGAARPVIVSGFDVHLDGDRLVYVKEECGAEDVDAWFFLHLYPVDEADLPDRRRRHGFDNLDFVFERYGRRGRGRCVAVRALPDYGIASIHTGQYMPGRDPEWSGMASMSVSRSGAADSGAVGDLIASVEGARPIVVSGFDVYLEENRLVYVKEECGAEDVDAWFFLHLYPVDEADLPDRRRRHGFDNLDFVFGKDGLRGGGRCAVARSLPGYEIASIHTGQYRPGQDPEWDERVDLEACPPGPGC